MTTEQLTEPHAAEPPHASRNLRPRFTPEQNKMLRARKRPGSYRATISIRTMQEALLQTFKKDVEEVINGEIVRRNPKPSELASAATAWDRLEERRRIMAGIGAPKPVAAVNDKTKLEPVKVHELTLDVPEIVPRGTIDPTTTTT